MVATAGKWWQLKKLLATKDSGLSGKLKDLRLLSRSCLPRQAQLGTPFARNTLPSGHEPSEHSDCLVQPVTVEFKLANNPPQGHIQSYSASR